MDGERCVVINTASVALMLPAARELAGHGIRVMMIASGIMKTPMLLGMPKEVQDTLGKNGAIPVSAGQTSRIRIAGKNHHRDCLPAMVQ